MKFSAKIISRDNGYVSDRYKDKEEFIEESVKESL